MRSTKGVRQTGQLRRSPRQQNRTRDPMLEMFGAVEGPLRDLAQELEDKYHLTRNQAAFFTVRHMFRTDNEAAQFLGIHSQTIVNWRKSANYASWQRTDGTIANFADAEKEYRERLRDVSVHLMEVLAVDAVRETQNLLNATSKKYNQKGDVIAEEPDYGSRAKGIEIVSRWINKGWNENSGNETDPRYLAVMDRFTRFLEGQNRLPAGQTVDGEVVKEVEVGVSG